MVRRENMARQYLQIRNAPDTQTGFFGNGPTRLESFLDNLEKNTDNLVKIPAVGEAAALILQMEYRQEAAKEIAKRLPQPNSNQANSPNNQRSSETNNAKRFQPLRYALALENGLAPDWAAQLPDDWFGAELKVMILRRLDDQEALSRALYEARTYEGQLADQDFYLGFFSILGIFGLGLLFSILMSGRYARVAGKRFYQLTPLLLPQNHLLRFCGWFLLGFIIMSALGEWLLADRVADYVAMLLIYLGQIAWGLAVLRYFLFRGDVKAIFQQLGWADLRMRFFNLFQIIGGCCILVALSQIAVLVMQITGWPLDMSESQARYEAMLSQPVANAVLLILTCLLAPLFEEAVFRGLIFRGVLSWGRPSYAFIFSAGLFAMVHPLAIWPAAFALGLGLALIYYRTANILICIWAHALFNLLSLLLMSAG